MLSLKITHASQRCFAHYSLPTKKIEKEEDERGLDLVDAETSPLLDRSLHITWSQKTQAEIRRLVMRSLGYIGGLCEDKKSGRRA